MHSLNPVVRPWKASLNPYQPPCNGNSEFEAEISERLLPDDSLRKSLALLVAGAGLISTLIGFILGLYGVALVVASVGGKGRFAGRAFIAMPLGAIALTIATLLVLFGSLALRYSFRKHKQDE